MILPYFRRAYAVMRCEGISACLQEWRQSHVITCINNNHILALFPNLVYMRRVLHKEELRLNICVYYWCAQLTVCGGKLRNFQFPPICFVIDDLWSCLFLSPILVLPVTCSKSCQGSRWRMHFNPSRGFDWKIISRLTFVVDMYFFLLTLVRAQG